MRKERTRKIFVFVILFCFILTSILVFVPKDENKPLPEDPVAEIPEPVEPELIGPVVEPDPVEPTEPAVKPKLVSFSQAGKAQSEVDANPNDGDGTGALILCKMPPGTEIVLDMEGDLREGWIQLINKPSKEPMLSIRAGIYEVVLLGIIPTDGLAKQLGDTHIAGSGKESVRIEPGTILGTVGSPLKNRWEELEGCNLVIGIGVYPDHVDLIEPSVASILEAITR